MNRIDDPRLLFYLRHQELIDEWAAIRDDVRHAAIEFYESIALDLEAEAGALGDDTVVVRSDGGYGFVGLGRQAWFAGDEPRVAIVLEWQRRTASFTAGHRLAGIRVELDTPGGRHLSSAIRDLVRSKREACGFPSSSQYWPAYSAASGAEGEEYWKDLQPYRHQLVALVRSAWDGFAEDVTMAIADSRNPAV